MEQNTDFSGWSAVKRQVQGPGFWLKVQLIALLYLAGPTLVALAINRQFGMEWVWLLFIVVLVVDYFVITRYELWAAVLTGSGVYSQLGGEEVFSKKDFWDTVPEALRKVYDTIIVTYKWRWFSLFGLCVIQTRGNTFLAYPIIVCAFVVIMTSHRYVTKEKAKKAQEQIYALFSGTLVVTVAYAAVIGWFPEVRPYITAGSSAYRIEQDINAAYEAELQKDADRIGKKLKEMDARLTFNQKVARLTPEDQATWERATRGWTREQMAAIRERAYPTLKSTIKEILPSEVQEWWDRPWFKRDAQAASAPSPTQTASAPAAASAPAPVAAPAAPTPWQWQGTYTPSQGALPIGTPPAGRYCLKSTGTHLQIFWSVDRTRSEYHPIDGDGRLPNGAPFVSQTATVPFPGLPYGAVWVEEGGTRHWVAGGQRFEVKGNHPLTLRTNIGPRSQDVLGSGSLKVALVGC